MALAVRRNTEAPYLEWFGFEDAPFAVTASPRYAFASQSHVKAINSLRYVVYSKTAFAICDGVVGSGKTTSAKILKEDLQSNGIATIYLQDVPGDTTRQTEGALARAVVSEFNLPKVQANSVDGHLRTIAEFARRNDDEGSTTVVIIDQAHRLKAAGIQAVLRLLMLQTNESSLVTVLLFGESPKILRAVRSNEALHSRLAARASLRPFAPDEVRDMLAHRLFVAGRKETLFTPRAVDALAEASGGVPRRICRFADLACTKAYVAQQTKVDVAHVTEAARELMLTDEEEDE
jgi:general secretion pathway protein A